MMFDPKRLPYFVYQSYRMGVIAWPLTIEKTLNHGITSLNTLTDIVFYLHHPELLGKPLAASDVRLIQEWKKFSHLVAGRRDAYVKHSQEIKDMHPSSGIMPFQ